MRWAILFLGLIGCLPTKKKQQEAAAIASALRADEDDRARRQREQFERDHASADAAPAPTTAITAPAATVAATTAATTTVDPKAHICPMAAERAIKRMTQCGLNTDGFTPTSMCKTMKYDELSFLASRSCPEMSAILSGK